MMNTLEIAHFNPDFSEKVGVTTKYFTSSNTTLTELTTYFVCKLKILDPSKRFFLSKHKPRLCAITNDQVQKGLNNFIGNGLIFFNEFSTLPVTLTAEFNGAPIFILKNEKTANGINFGALILTQHLNLIQFEHLIKKTLKKISNWAFAKRNIKISVWPGNFTCFDMGLILCQNCFMRTKNGMLKIIREQTGKKEISFFEKFCPNYQMSHIPKIREAGQIFSDNFSDQVFITIL